MSCDIIEGRSAGRTPEEETIIFDSTGTALQGAAAAQAVYEEAPGGGIGLRPKLAG